MKKTLLNGYNPTGGQSHVKTYKNSNQLQQIIFSEHSIDTIIIKGKNHITGIKLNTLNYVSLSKLS